MKTVAYLPVGTAKKQFEKLVSKGDILELCTGELVTFTEMKRVNFVGVCNGKGIRVPIYRDKYNNTPYVLKLTGKKDKSVIVKSALIDKFKLGQLFSLEGHKETFMFVENTVKKNKPKTVAIDLATGKQFTIGNGFNIIKVDVNKMKRELAK
jgi:hypothetical protein